MVEIVVAVVRNEQGKFLIWQRSPCTEGAFKWQLPRGVPLAGETLGECAMRACLQSFGIQISVSEMLMDMTCIYQHRVFHGSVFATEMKKNGLSQKELDFHEMIDVRWITPEEADRYDLCPASAEILLSLRAEGDQATHAYG